MKKIKKIDENKKEDESEIDSDLVVKRHKTLNLNYLVSNFNGLLNSKNYKYVKTTFKNENMDSLDLPQIKRAQSKSGVRSFRKSVVQSSHFQHNFPLFLRESDIQEIISYYVYLKESIGNLKKKKFSVPDYIEETYLYSSYS